MRVIVDGFADVLQCFLVGKDVLGMELCLFFCVCVVCVLLGSSGFVRALHPFCIGRVRAACGARLPKFKDVVWRPRCFHICVFLLLMFVPSHHLSAVIFRFHGCFCMPSWEAETFAPFGKKSGASLPKTRKVWHG